MELPTKRIALLIDADNVQAASLESILASVATIGGADLRQAFGDWHGGGLNKWKAVLDPNGIKPIQQFSYTPGKNATDMAMTIAAVNLLRTWAFDAFAIASSDADFTPLTMHLLENGVAVHGFGESKTPTAFVKACTTFTCIDLPRKAVAKKIATMPERLANPSDNSALVKKLRAAIAEAAGSDGWANLSTVANRGQIQAKSYGYTKLSELVGRIGHFETRRVDKTVLIRVKPVAKKAEKVTA